MQCRQYYDGKLSLKKGRNWWNDVAFTINRYNDNSKKMQKAIYILHKNITNEFLCKKTLFYFRNALSQTPLQETVEI